MLLDVSSRARDLLFLCAEEKQILRPPLSGTAAAVRSLTQSTFVDEYDGLGAGALGIISLMFLTLRASPCYGAAIS